MIEFETKVQNLKYKVLCEVARHAFNKTLFENIIDIPKLIIPGLQPTMRCCVYKERAILTERVKLAMGGDKNNPNVIEVIDIACDECPVGGFEVSNACRGCIAHRCEGVCKRNAITFDSNQKAHIDKSKCVECGLCENVCPYSAIINYKRPCENSCKVNAISMSETKAACIDNDKCISCGACVYQCPFGAIMDKSFILDMINLIENSDNNKKYKTYAVIAPSISSQFKYSKLGQVVEGVKKLGFYSVIEAALGADIVAYLESQEVLEKEFLTSSCCPSFVYYIKKQFPLLEKYISKNLSPMAVIGKQIKKIEPDSKVVFIGPCTSKKLECKEESVKPYIDCVITFEELQALFDSKDIDLTKLSGEPLDNASYYGRIFARSGGLSDAVKEALIETGNIEFDFKPIICDGISECGKELFKISKNIQNGNFIEGMACKGGCIGGAGCLTHGDKNKKEVDAYGMQAYEKKIIDAISVVGSLNNLL